MATVLAWQRVEVQPTSAALGADIEGVDISRELPIETSDAIKRAWCDHLVQRFRGQRLDDRADAVQRPSRRVRLGEESERLLDALWAHAARPQLTGYQQWRVGDLVLWDNRCLMHRRDEFDPNSRGLMHRSQINGDRPD